MFRDLIFYTLGLAFLLLFFLDEKIEWYETMTMFILYILYAIFMKYNSTIEYFVKRKFKKKSSKIDVACIDSYNNNINIVYNLKKKLIKF